MSTKLFLQYKRWIIDPNKFTFLDGKSTIAALSVLITLAGLSPDYRRTLAGPEYMDRPVVQ